MMGERQLEQFIHEFVRLWENQLNIQWDPGADVISDEGPHLSLLPDEYLPSLDRLLYQLRSRIEKDIQKEDVSKVTEAVKALVILCRNLDNIPFIASCQFVSSCISIASLALTSSLNGQLVGGEVQDCVVIVCQFLEALYDPYFSWRKPATSQDVTDSSKIRYQPALLAVEVIPFIYDCFQHSNMDSIPTVVRSLIDVLGSIIKGAQHNAAKAICPATVQLLQRVLLSSSDHPIVANIVLRCEIAMVHALLDTRPDQCQMEIGEMMEIYQNTLGLLVMKDAVVPSQALADSSIVNRTELICQAVRTIAEFLRHRRRESLQTLLARTGVVDFLIMLLFDAKLNPDDKKVVSVAIISTITAVLQNNLPAKESVTSCSGYQKLIEALKSLGQPTREMILSLLAMARDEEEYRDAENVDVLVVRNVESLAHLLNWLPDIEDYELQTHTATEINKLCSSSLQSKAICCQRGMLSHVISALESHKKLHIRSTLQLLRLIQSLGTHSITAAELKQVLRLMREADDGNKFPYASYVLHYLSSMSKKDAGCQECHYYFDVQHETEGIIVSDINQWQNPGYGLSLCTWIRLDNVDTSAFSYSRRQLFSLSSDKGQVFEAFFLSDGTLVCAVAWKKEYTTALVHSVILNDQQWHSICIAFVPSRRLFGQSHLCVYVDGTQRLTVNMRLPPVNEVFSSLSICAPPVKSRTDLHGKAEFFPSSLPRKKNASDVRSSAVGLVQHVPNYFSLPISLTSLKSATGDQHSDPGVRSVPLGTQDSIWGKPICLHGQIGTFALFQEALTLQHVRIFHDAGANSTSLWNSEENSEAADFYSKVAVFLSARAYHNFVCTDLSPNRLFNGHTLAPFCTTWDVKDVLSCIGGVQALFPILETAAHANDENVLCVDHMPSPAIEKTDTEGWEILPSSSYSDWKLEQNPVSGFLSLLRNVLHRHPYNTEQLQRGSNIAIVGSLMHKVHPSLLDVQVLMAVQLLVEFARDFHDPNLLQSLYQYLLFDMRIWARSPFHVRIGHVQYLTNLVREDRATFRKKYGTQYLLDTIKQHYNNGDSCDLSLDDRKTMRQSLLGIIKLYINKEITINDMSAILGFLFSVRDNEMITEMLDVLLTYVESKHCRDQFFLLILEPRCIEILYALLLEKIFTTELREKVLKLMIHVLKSDRVYEKSKTRLYLHDVGFQGLLCLMQGQTSSLEITHLLTDLILSRDHSSLFSGALALAYSLAEENLEIKLEFSKRLLAFALSRPNAPSMFTKQISWHECIARLLVRRPITASGYSGVKPMVPDLIDLDGDLVPALTPRQALTPLSPSKMWPSPGLNASAMNLGLGLSLEQDLKDVAESVQNLVAGAVTGNLTGNLQNVAEVMADNFQNVAGNVHSAVNSAVNSAYSMIRQKTLQVQGSLEELGETTLQRLKRRSQSAQGAADSNIDVPDATALNGSSPRLRNSFNKFLVAPVEVAVDALNLDQSDDEIIRNKQRESSQSVSSRGNSVTATGKTLSDFAPYESVDMETYTLISEVSGQWSGLVLDPATDPEEDLCGTVISLYLVLMWRGITGSSREDWRERSQVLSCINLLGLNNELYRSHLEIKRRLIEMIVQAATTDLRQLPPNASTTNAAAAARSHANCQHAIRWVYDLVVLDPHEDEAKKMSMKLLELTLAMLDALNIFREEDLPAQNSEIYHIALALLVRFAASSNAELCAMASARLHALVQFNSQPDVKNFAYLLYHINSTLRQLKEGDEEDRYACLIPIMKAVLEKAGHDLELEAALPALSPLNSSFFDQFPLIRDDDAWKMWMEEQVRPKSDKMRSVHLQFLPETMNRCWAESDEAAMLAVHRRNRQVNESKLKFQMQILDVFRSRQSEEHQRYNGLLSLQRGHALVIRKKWRQLKQFLTGPRGAWAHRINLEHKWKLSNCENSSRMRLKLVPNPHFDPHVQASRLRDNTGSPVDVHSPDSLNSLLPSTVANQALKRIVDAQEPEDSLTEEDLALAASLEKEELGEGKEKVTISEDCELVTLMSVIKGRLEVTRAYVCFWDAGLGEDGERTDFKWSLNQLQEVHLRRYNLRRSALEFFLTDQTNYFVNFTTKTRNRIYSRILSLRPPNLLYHSSRSPADVLRSSGLTQRWLQREISNFDYLMQLNTIAGRTYNDLSQYPVFPWILADYHSRTLDLNNPATFRDLSRPIGVVNPKNAKEVQAKYEHFEDPSGTIAKFHYGTHYSNAAGVLHYLVRMEPFTSLHIELQSGRFDVADRQFHSMNSTWRLLMDNPNDVKELIPEFFYQPEFLINMNKLDLGVLQATKHRVDDVELPPWAKSPQDFIDQHRQALESDYVSAHLHEWIDLIFGYKQRGPAAVEALNVFYYCSYEGAVDLDAITDPVERQAVEGMINHFGQTPCQLFKEPHPPRPNVAESLTKSKYPPSILPYLNRLSCVHVAELCPESRDWVAYMAIPNVDPQRNRGYGYQTAVTPDVLVTISRSGCVGLHSWVSHDKNLTNGFSLEKDSTLNNARNRRRLNDLLHPSVNLNSRLVLVSADCKCLFVAGQLDNSVKVYSLPRFRFLSSAQQHIDIVTCLALDESGSLLMSGSRDTTCIVWDLSSGPSGSGQLKPIQVLYGHDKPVSCVALSMSLDMAVSGSLDGTVNVHTIKEGQYIRTLEPPNAGIEPMITRLTLSNQGHVIFSVEEKENYSLHCYTINGQEVGRSFSPFAFTALAAADDYVATADTSGDVSFRRILGLLPQETVQMRTYVDHLILAPRNTHLLAALRDGKVVIVAPTVPVDRKSFSSI